MKKRLLIVLGSMPLTACAMFGSESDSGLPLKNCMENKSSPDCVSRLYLSEDGKNDTINNDKKKFYLEIHKKTVRHSFCDNVPDKEKCIVNMDGVARYFYERGDVKNPDANGDWPLPEKVGVALEGGGSKASPFALGVLAGLQQGNFLKNHVGAISSVSGGTYAAGYFYNRFFDYMNPEISARLEKEYKNSKDSYGEYLTDIFRPCLPNKHEKLLKHIPDYNAISCHEIPKDNNSAADKTSPAQNSVVRKDGANEKRESYIKYVWRNADIISGTYQGSFSDSDFPFAPATVGQYLTLLGESAAVMPLTVISRDLFREPFSASPSKLAYKQGIERQFGYSPMTWKSPAEPAVGPEGQAPVARDIQDRRRSRTLKELRDYEQKFRQSGRNVPFWIINTTAPSHINGVSWLSRQDRDPVRQTFELTWNGQGSGVYGYTRRLPSAVWEPLGKPIEAMPIMDAVVASAAFADSDETKVTSALGRIAAGTVTTVTSTLWFSEIPNYNVDNSQRSAAQIAPYPFYLYFISQGMNTPYIHRAIG